MPEDKLKYKRVFYAWPQIGDSDFGARHGMVRITIESDCYMMPEQEIPEMIETLNEMMDAGFMTEEQVRQEEEALNKYISENTKNR